jgi:hypothetical protein
MTVRNKRFLIRLALHSSVLTLLLIFVLILSAIGAMSTASFFSLFFLIYLLTLRLNPIPGLIEVKMIQEAVCADCGEVTQLVAVWSCGCGYLTWRPRSALSPCRYCGKTYEFVVCNRCEATILI